VCAFGPPHFGADDEAVGAGVESARALLGTRGWARCEDDNNPQLSMAPYAKFLKWRQTAAGLGEVQARWVIRIPTEERPERLT
jgi:hypothetical protein